MTVTLRPATQADQQKIKALIHEVGINPMGLEWERFIVADDAGEFVGCAQIKPHHDGVRELASVAVTPGRQGEGIGSMLVRALVEREPGTLYLTCRKQNVTYYERFGFVEIAPGEYPRSFRLVMRAARLLAKLAGLEGAALMRRGQA